MKNLEKVVKKVDIRVFLFVRNKKMFENYFFFLINV